MAEEKLTHWRKLDPGEYIGSYTLALTNAEGYGELVVKIVGYKREGVIAAPGKPKEEKTLLMLEGQKPMVMNKVNQKRMAKLFGPFIEKWVGKRITLYVDKVSAFGEMVDALRVRPTLPPEPAAPAPKQKIELTPDYKGWDGAKKALEEKVYTIEQLKEKYIISVENEKLLTTK